MTTTERPSPKDESKDMRRYRVLFIAACMQYAMLFDDDDFSGLVAEVGMKYQEDWHARFDDRLGLAAIIIDELYALRGPDSDEQS